MPFELGVFVGAQRFGTREHRRKRCIVFDRERYRYQRLISDISGHDIHEHAGSPEKMILELTSWLRNHSHVALVPGGRAIANDYSTFRLALSAILVDRRLSHREMMFGDYCAIIAQYLKTAAT